MNKDSALQEVRTIEARLAELRKIIEQPEEVGLWVPTRCSTYYTIGVDGDVQHQYRGDNVFFYSSGNFFPTKSIARKASELQRNFNHVMRAAFQADQDAGEWSEERRRSVYMSGGKWMAIERRRPCSDICVHTEEQGDEAIRLLNAWQAKEDAKS